MKKDNGVVKRVFVTPDKHFPLHDKKAINVVKKAIEKVKTEKPEIIDTIQTSGKLEEDTENLLKQVIEQYKK